MYGKNVLPSNSVWKAFETLLKIIQIGFEHFTAGSSIPAEF